MNERIKELAEQVDLLWSERDGCWRAYDDSKDLERLVELVEAAAVAREREACAQLCEEYFTPNLGKEIATTIRARGEK
jgi:hypothetical protein